MVGLLLLGLVESSVEMAEDIKGKTSALQPRLELMTETDEVNTVCRTRIATVRGPG